MLLLSVPTLAAEVPPDTLSTQTAIPPMPPLPTPPRVPDPNEVKTLTVKQLQDIIEAARLQGVNQGRAEAAHMIEINNAANQVFADLDKQASKSDEKKSLEESSSKTGIEKK